jgi:hypothetical protein
MADGSDKLWNGFMTGASALITLFASIIALVFAGGLLYVAWPQIGGRVGWTVHPDDVDLVQRVGLTNILMTPRTVFTNGSGVQLTVVCVETNGTRLAFTPADNSLRRLTPETGEVPGMCWDRRFIYEQPMTTAERLERVKWTLPAGWTR